MKFSFKSSILILAAAFFALNACRPDNPKSSQMTEIDLEIAISQVDAASAYITITPDSEDKTYCWGILPDAVWSGIAGESLADALSQIPETDLIASQTATGVVRKAIAVLSPETGYVVFGYSVSSDKSSHGQKVSYKSFTTTAKASETELNVTVEITGERMTQVDATYTPVDMNVTYYPDYIDDDTYQLYGGDIKGVIEYFNETMQYSADYYGVTMQELVSKLINRGIKKSTYDYLKPSTTYWFFVAEINADGEVLGMDCKSATTTERIMSDISIDLNIEKDSIFQTHIYASVHPSDPDEGYYMALFPKADFNAYGGAQGDEAFMDYVVEKIGDNMEDLLYYGDMEGYFWKLTPGTEYVLVAFTSNETWTSPLFKAECTTISVIDYKDLKVDISFESISEVQINAVLRPNDALVPFHYSFMTKEEFGKYPTPEAAVQADFDDYIQSWLDYYSEYNDTREDIIGYLTRYGDRYYTETNLSAGTEYILWAASFTPSGEMVSAPSYAEFKTLDWIPDETTTVVPVLGNCYDAGAIHKLYTTYSLQILEDVETSNAATWYIGFFKGDHTSKPDDWIAAHGIMNGKQNITGPKSVLLNPGIWTVCAIGKNADGQWGKGYTELIYMDEGHYSDPSTFPQELLDEFGMPIFSGRMSPSSEELKIPYAPANPDKDNTGSIDMPGRQRFAIYME